MSIEPRLTLDEKLITIILHPNIISHLAPYKEEHGGTAHSNPSIPCEVVLSKL